MQEKIIEHIPPSNFNSGLLIRDHLHSCENINARITWFLINKNKLSYLPSHMVKQAAAELQFVPRASLFVPVAKTQIQENKHIKSSTVDQNDQQYSC